MAISLESISRSSGIKAPRIVLHGPAGVGKTTFGSSAPNPIFIQTEDGLGKLEVDAFPFTQTFQDVLDALNILHTSEHNYQTVVLDSLDHLEPLLWKHLCNHYVGPKGERYESIEDFGFGKGYMLALDLWRQLLSALFDLRNDRGMAFILIAHSEIKRFESPMTDSYDRYQIKLHKRASDLVQESVDCVMFADYKTVIEKEEGGFNKVKTRGISTGQRYLYTEARPSFIAKNRYGLPPELPMSWQTFSDALTQPVSQK